MGRWKKSYRKRFTLNSGFNRIDREILRDYLIEYRTTATKIWKPDVPTLDDLPIVVHNDVNDLAGIEEGGVNRYEEEEKHQNQQHNKKSWLINGVEFPALVVKDVSQNPYWIMPHFLDGRQRRVVHLLCINVGLYHSSVGCGTSDDGRPPRCVVISVHPLGLGLLISELNRPPHMPLKSCLPWYCNHHIGSMVANIQQKNKVDAKTSSKVIVGDDDMKCNDGDNNDNMLDFHFNGKSSSLMMWNNCEVSSSDQDKNNQTFNNHDLEAAEIDAACNSHKRYIDAVTKEGRRRIETLIDQPWMCLRDDNLHDTFDFEQLEKEDLSCVKQIGCEVESSSPKIPCSESAARITTVSNDDQLNRSKDENNKMAETNIEKIVGLEDTTAGNIVMDGEGPGLGCEWMFVDTEDKMKQCANEILISKTSSLGFDLEMFNINKYTGTTCLLQLSIDNKDYVIDVFSPGVWNKVSLLIPVFADPTIIKIGHAIGGMDVQALHRDFGIFVVNAFDTYEAARVLKLKRAGLAAVCKHYNLPSSKEYEELKSKYQTTDWRKRPLTGPMVKYSRYDVHYLIQLRRLMIRDLTKGDLWGSVEESDAEGLLVANALAATFRNLDCDDEVMAIEDDLQNEAVQGLNDSLENNCTSTDDVFDDAHSYWPDEEKENNTFRTIYDAKDLRMCSSLMTVLSQSQESCLKLWSTKSSEQVMKNESFLNAISDSKILWTAGHMKIFESLITWRKQSARMIGTLPGLVCTTDFLVHIAQHRPNCESSLRQLEYFLPDLLLDEHRLYQSEIYAIVKSHEDDFKANDNPLEHKQENRQKESMFEYFSKEMRNVKQPSITLATLCVVGLSFFVLRRRKI
mmetsp:Transcript_25560/g.29494  ORF Transcript_25560/g.29494 Transcript_25560/m.29494 type:complete len:852 (+) Transcript_25560:71-2626(+)